MAENRCPDIAGGDIQVNSFNLLSGHERQLYLLGEEALKRELARFPVIEEVEPHQLARQEGISPYFVSDL